MTPQEALAQALVAANVWQRMEVDNESDEEVAAAILDALREQGWCVTTMTGQLKMAEEHGAQQERERLRAQKCDIWCANCGEHVSTDEADR